jgi:hypothetical protein
MEALHFHAGHGHRVARAFSWKGAAVQGGLEPRSRRIAVVKAVTRQLQVMTLWSGKDL